MRITSQMAFNTLVGQVQKNLSDYTKLQEQISSNKSLTVPSDDPSGTSTAISLNVQQTAVASYLSNLSDAQTYLTSTDSALQQISDLLSQAMQIASAQGTETSTSTTRLGAADEVDELISQAIDIANTQVNGRYLFSGYQTDTAAYSEVGRIMPAYADGGNTYTGTATSSGTYTGTENKTYLVKVVTAGTVGTAQYQVSEDGGTTWGSVQTLQSGENAIYDDLNSTDNGVKLSFSDGTFAADDQFKVYIGAGQYQGDSGEIQVNSGQNAKITTNITGQEAFEDTGLFAALNRLKVGLGNDSTTDITSALADLQDVSDAMTSATTKVGNRMVRAEIATNNLTALQETLTSTYSDLTEPDSITAAAKLSVLQTTLSASTQMLSSIIPDNLFNYL